MTGLLDPITETNGMSPLLKAALRLGIPAVLALILIGFLMSTVNQKLDGITAVAGDARQHYTAQSEHSYKVDAALKDLQRYLRMICVNTARNDVDRSSCLGQ